MYAATTFVCLYKRSTWFTFFCRSQELTAISFFSPAGYLCMLWIGHSNKFTNDMINSRAALPHSRSHPGVKIGVKTANFTMARIAMRQQSWKRKEKKSILLKFYKSFPLQYNHQSHNSEQNRLQPGMLAQHDGNVADSGNISSNASDYVSFPI